MGFFDEIFADVKVFTEEIQSIKDELVSSVLDPTGELRDTVNEIAGEITGHGSPAAVTDDTATIAATDDTSVTDDSANDSQSTAK